MAAFITMESEVAKAAEPVGVTVAGENAHVAPAGIPPVQAKVIVDLAKLVAAKEPEMKAAYGL